MKNTMTYKGYTGTVEFSEEDGCLFGRVVGINDIISYEGQSIPEIRQDFHEMIDWYLKECASKGKQPDKPFSGAIMVNIEPKLQERLEQQALETGLTFSEIVASKLGAV